MSVPVQLATWSLLHVVARVFHVLCIDYCTSIRIPPYLPSTSSKVQAQQHSHELKLRFLTLSLAYGQLSSSNPFAKIVSETCWLVVRALWILTSLSLSFTF